MDIENIILIACIPVILALLVYMHYGWYDDVKNRKYKGNKLKKYADKIKKP